MTSDRETKRQAEALDGGIAESEHTVDAGSQQRFTSSGDKPTVQPDILHPKPSASDLAYPKPIAKPANAGPGLELVVKIFETGRDTSAFTISNVIVEYPHECEAILEFVEQQRDAKFALEVVLQAHEKNRKKQGVSFKDGAIDFGHGGLAPAIRPFPVPAGPPSDEKDSRIKAEQAEIKKQEARSAQEHGDKANDPIGDAFKKRFGKPEKQSTEQHARDKKIDGALHPDAGQPDAGQRDDGAESPLELRKRL
ncbi:MAG TPA: hypothetical protein VIV11_06955 [Kofleriaceae bacterium]